MVRFAYCICILKEYSWREGGNIYTHRAAAKRSAVHLKAVQETDKGLKKNRGKKCFI